MIVHVQSTSIKNLKWQTKPLGQASNLDLAEDWDEIEKGLISAF